MKYDWNGHIVFTAYDVEVCEEQEYEIVIRSNEASPGRDMLEIRQKVQGWQAWAFRFYEYWH